MRSLSIVLGVILLVLAGLSLAPDTTLISYINATHAVLPGAVLVIPYIDVVHDILPQAIVVTTFLLLLTIGIDYSKAKSFQRTAERSNMPRLAPPAAQADAELIDFMAKLKESMIDLNRDNSQKIGKAKLLPLTADKIQMPRVAPLSKQSNQEPTYLMTGLSGDGNARIGATGRFLHEKTFEKDHRFGFGIDLGASNIAIAIAETGSDQANIIEIPQVLGPSQVGANPTLPSELCIPHPDEFPKGALSLPWRTSDDTPIIGHFAREYGARAPDRLIRCARLWLSNPHIDPHQRNLPLRSNIESEKLSAFDCLRRCLEHIREGLLYTARNRADKLALADAEVVLAVPPYFDASTKSLAAEAAEAAGLGKIVLLEEPMAALYAWIAHVGKAWRDHIRPGDIILVCDVGGGTCDFSLIAISEKGGFLDLNRTSVAEQLLIGGDNMDLALAHALCARLEAEGISIGGPQFTLLTDSARKAKEIMFADGSVTELPIVIPELVSTKLNRNTLEEVILDGFFPIIDIKNFPEKPQGTGLRELDLPYATDPVISKHLARFLMLNRDNESSSEIPPGSIGTEAHSGRRLLPNAVLFSGGVFKADLIRRRLLDLLATWNGGQAVNELGGHDTELAVARGASLFGRNRITGKGIRIKAGTSCSYYISLDASMPAVPGVKLPLKAVCVVPQGMEEGSEVQIEGRDFILVTGEPTEFRFFSSEARKADVPGQIIADVERELSEVNRFEAEMPGVENISVGQPVPVRINAVLTKHGCLELWMKHIKSDRRWKIELAVKAE